MQQIVHTVIIKPTKQCNADCSYCSAPPDGERVWRVADFQRYFDKLAPYLAERSVLIWHGGEPMLLGPDFYRACFAYARAQKPEIRFALQSNLLLYDSAKWRTVFTEIFDGQISSSFDPDERNRTIRGSTEAYSKQFYTVMDAVIDDGFRPLVIGTYTQTTWPYAMAMYERSLAAGDRGFSLRFNYRFPAGRDVGMGEMLTPETYGQMLLALYDRWIVDLPAFTITPLDQMFLKVAGREGNRCPWTRSCGGRFLEIEPNGDVYNCGEFADLDDAPQWRFGNLREQELSEMFASRPSTLIRRRRVDLPLDCQSCRHFGECEGGCMRDAVLYEHGLGGKFHYCHSWMMVFDRIKASIRSGEADGLLRRYGLDPVAVRAGVAA